MSKAKTQPTKAKRHSYLDVLNILAIVSVLFMHHNGNVHSFSQSSSWATSLAVETVFTSPCPFLS